MPAGDVLATGLAEALETGLPPAVLARVAELLKEDRYRELLQAEIDNRRMAQQHAVTHRSLEGIGETVAHINPTSFHFWGTKLGYDCWSDKRFLHEYLRDVPEARVKCGGTKLQFGYTAAAPKRVRVKTYAST